MNTNEWEILKELIRKSLEEDEKTTCEVMDIANREMERIDSSEIDSEFKKVFSKEITENLIGLAAQGRCTEDEIIRYLELLDDDDVIDIRTSGKKLYIKTSGDIVPVTLSYILGINEDYIEEVPIFGRYSFFVIDSQKLESSQACLEINFYTPSQLIDEIKIIADNPERNEEKIKEIISDGLYENWEDFIEMPFTVELEEQVIAIAFGKYIPEAKKTIGESLSINPKLFIEVSNPFETVLLIDTCRWILDPNFGEEQWFL